MYIDTHCHLQHCFSPENLQSGIIGTLNKVSRLIDISTNIDEILKSGPASYPNGVIKSFGLYPENAGSFGKDMEKMFIKSINDYSPRAIGEIGLEYYHQCGTPAEQEKLFRFQIEIALELGLPLLIHTREAFNDTYMILKSYNIGSPVIIHCFSYNLRQAEDFLSLGFYLSFAGNLTYKKSPDIREAVVKVPLDRILFETDAPYLTPVPLRGRPNLPEYVGYTYKFAAELRGMELSRLCEAVEKNYDKIF